MNDTVTAIPMHFSLYTLAAWKFTIMTQLEQSFSMQRNWGAMGEGESDEVRAALCMVCAMVCLVCGLFSMQRGWGAMGEGGVIAAAHL